MLYNLKRLREEAHISQKLLADAVGVSQQSINKYENHNIEPDIETLIRISDYFDISIDYLVGRTDVRRKAEVVHSYELNKSESKMFDGYRKLNPRQKRSVDLIIDTFNET